MHTKSCAKSPSKCQGLQIVCNESQGGQGTNVSYAVSDDELLKFRTLRKGDRNETLTTAYD
jgi:hypothetical protein